MSAHSHTAAGRSTKMLGANLNPHIKPGGFSTCLGSTHSPRKRNFCRIGSEELKQRADEVLRRRGWIEGASSFDRSVNAGVAARKAAVKLAAGPVELP